MAAQWEHKNSQIQKIKALEAKVIGVNKETLYSRPKFVGKYRLDFLLLSDRTNKTIKAYCPYGGKGILDFGMTKKKTHILDNSEKNDQDM
ncbi:Peroxiredoxin [Candidatus Nitrososphaera evergladensis SR1]|uniref:Peroxiredoxin n=1 Tax=Candidatus Nitrososphaera evergladensis SR1 TaxID=1459636 RepID=A0A075MP46_9ARCH|nr:redoxin domain-containing protein [Candidatus Nitrososphaera evergladensis]AIF83296.1 Peroxiredoxin [Candidatus Nitrososphaera evergladensis SR1]